MQHHITISFPRGQEALLSALAVSALSSPRPDDREYKIPQVGTGRRSQYYVLHNDGTFKYGYDTGEGAYEVAKQKTPRVQHGKFGYRDQDGNDVRLEYQAGEGGFQPSGTHIPSASPEFYAAHAEAQARPPFRDPLADSNTDASYGFRFAEDGLSRTEQSDADGNVRGSYAYTDEEGRTRSYTYTAGRDVGFVIEGSDLPQAPLAPGETPASTRLSSGAGAAAAAAAAASFRGSTSQTSQAPGATSFGGSTSFGGFRTGFRQPTVQSGAHGASTFRASTASGSTAAHGTQTSQSGAHGGSAFRSATAVGSYGSRRTPVTQTSTHGASTFHSSTASGAAATYRAPTSSQRQSTTFGATKYTGELANTRTSLGSDGSRSFAYETSSHSRSEAEDSDDNVVGSFDFVASDDGQRRAVKYEASRDTGFIAEGRHIPVGPAVPGAPSGQPTGRIVPVQEVPFVDPLADSGTDASYGFAFDSEQYSRSETADADGNVQGTYTVVDDDGTRRTYRFRAGKGIGFETEEVSTSRGPRPSRPSTTGSTSFTSTSTSATHGAASPSPVVSYSSPSSGRFSTSYRTGSSTGTGASSTTGTSFGTRTSFGTGTSAGRGSSFGTGTSARAGTSTVGGTSYRTGASAGRGASFQTGTSTSTGTSYRTGPTSKFSHSSVSPLRSPFTPTASREVFPGFQLHQYDATDNSDKYGYVLKFDR